MQTSLFFIFHTVRCHFSLSSLAPAVRPQVARIWNRCICHLGEKYSQSLCSEKRWCLSLPFWKLDWRELKGPVCQLGERRAEELLLATHHLEKLKSNFFLFFLLVYVALLPSTGCRQNCQGTWHGGGGVMVSEAAYMSASMRVDLKWVKGSL